MRHVLIFATAADVGAAAVAAHLRSMPEPVDARVMRPHALGLAQWLHRVDAQGRASTRIAFSGMNPIGSDDVAVIFSRIKYLPISRFQHATAKDKDYAAAELEALVASWFAEFGERCIPHVRRHVILAPRLAPQQWAAAAAQCGIPIARQSTATSERLRCVGRDPGEVPAAGATFGSYHGNGDDETVLVAGTHVVGGLAERLGTQCRAVARRLDHSLLEFRFLRNSGNPVLIDVSSVPILREPDSVLTVCDFIASLIPRAIAA